MRHIGDVDKRIAFILKSKHPVIVTPVGCPKESIVIRGKKLLRRSNATGATSRKWFT